MAEPIHINSGPACTASCCGRPLCWFIESSSNTLQFFYGLQNYQHHVLREEHVSVTPPLAQVLDEIVQMLTEDKFRGKMVVILAGYEQPIEELMA
eukprot:scaffold303849_cov17-Tisochrysis_lutea.AAC.1